MLNHAIVANMTTILFSRKTVFHFIMYKPGGADPHASHRNGVLIPAVNISFGDTILTFNGFTVQTTKEIERKIENENTDNITHMRI